MFGNDEGNTSLEEALLAEEFCISSHWMKRISHGAEVSSIFPTHISSHLVEMLSSIYSSLEETPLR